MNGADHNLLGIGIFSQLLLVINQETDGDVDRYAQRFERTLLRAIKELRRLQTDRIANLSIDACHADTLSPLVDIKAVAVAKRTHYQGNTEKVRATLAQTDLEITAAKGRVPKDLITENVPRAAHG